MDLLKRKVVWFLLFLLLVGITNGDELIDYMRSGTGTNAAYSGQTVVCQGFRYGYLPDTHNALHNITILSWNIKRAAGPVGRTDFRIYNHSNGIPDKVQISKEVDITLDTSYAWVNVTLDNHFQAINKTLYFMCIYNNQSTNYVHIANNGSDPYKAGSEYVFTTVWNNNSVSDDDFSIYGFEIIQDVSNPIAVIKTPLNNSQWINDDNIQIYTNYTDDYLLESFNISVLDPENTLNKTFLRTGIALESIENVTYVTLNKEGLWKIRAEVLDTHGKYGQKVYTLNITSRARKDSEILRQTKDLSNSINEVLDMIPVIMLYALFMILGYWMILTRNTVSGWMLYSISVGFDFLISGILYNKYNALANVSSGGFYGAMIAIFTFFLFALVFIKGISFYLLQTKVNMRE